MESNVVPAYPGVKALYNSLVDEEAPQLSYDVVAWLVLPAGGFPTVIGMIVVPENIQLLPVNGVGQPDYKFAGYSYCP